METEDRALQNVEHARMYWRWIYLLYGLCVSVSGCKLLDSVPYASIRLAEHGYYVRGSLVLPCSPLCGVGISENLEKGAGSGVDEPQNFQDL